MTDRTPNVTIDGEWVKSGPVRCALSPYENDLIIEDEHGNQIIVGNPLIQNVIACLREMGLV